MADNKVTAPPKTGSMPIDADALSALWTKAGQETSKYVQAAGSNAVDEHSLGDVISKTVGTVMDSQQALAAASDIVKWMKGSGKNGSADDHAAVIQKYIKTQHAKGLFSMATPAVGFAKLNKEQRDALSSADFGDPERRLFPITDQDDVDSAAHLISKAKNPDAVKQKVIAICKRKNLTCPSAWDRTGEKTFNVEFSIAPQPSKEDGDHVIVPAPIVFRCGDYPDKGFSLSPEEAEFSVVPTFPPSGVELDLEHKPTVLSGKLGMLSRFFVDPADPFLLAGECRIPKWLHAVLGPDDRKLSVAFDRHTKQVIGCGLVRNPRITDAAMMAAFARDEETRLATVEFEEETATEDNAPDEEEETPEEPAAVAPPGKKKKSKEPPVPPEEPAVPPVAKAAAKAPAKPPAKPPADEESEFSNAKMAAMEKRHREELAGMIDEQAVLFADGEIRSNRSLPRHRNLLITQYKQAAADDLRDPSSISFGTEAITRTELLRRTCHANEPHNLTQEEIKQSESGRTLFSKETTPGADGVDSEKPVSESRRKELLAMTTLGRKAGGIKC